ncbi:efflux RND transporter periplasmic adaptor subunit [Roseiconus lacunae]|uniref:HlyD family efflux transporter periplasmic adaptor subunit n=1 Tax=Roseiconus lacunae TaxID=2605694 RepID=A0ABT7PFA1_9BACT|nr:HlyD family efflux transporter periplasmic adaptor subunit [Roseiconus lacunae]MDM4015178.1 HlyD family efflux transporter periplasmic adaptor subunit [Roseiconus lacunae]
MQNHKVLKALVGSFLICVVLGSIWVMREHLFPASDTEQSATDKASASTSELEILELGSQARKNLNLVAKSARPADYWRTITIPGVVQDRPGVSDRGVTSPAIGAISQIHVYPGDTVRPGERLVTIQLFSEYLQSTQTQLFKASEEITLLQRETDRLSSVASTGGISKSRIIELNNEVRRQETLIKASKQELLNRGLAPAQVEQITRGSFVSSIEVVAPPPRTIALEQRPATQPTVSQASFVLDDQSADSIAYEVQQLSVELGQTVQAGQLIAELSNHQHLYVVGHAFKREAGWLERAAQEGRPVEIEFADDSAEVWPPVDQQFQIRHLSNTIDAESRTFDFYVPLDNQSRSYEKAGETFLVWRFRPGQRTRIQVPVEKLENVFILPSEAVAHEGPETFVYRQNGDLFNQIAVHVLHEDRRHVVIANDGSITPGTFLAQNAGASLRRVLKSQSASGEQPGLHVHADGTVHAAH